MPELEHIHLIAGNDEAAIKQAAQDLYRKLAGEGDAGDFGHEVISGVADNSEHAHTLCMETIQALQTLPFFGGEKIVWLKQANFFAENITGKSKRTQEGTEALLQVLLQGLGEGVHFILSAPGLSKARRFYKQLQKKIDLQLFEQVDFSQKGSEAAWLQEVRQQAKSKGLEFQHEALEHFAMLLGGNRRNLEQELEKLSLRTLQDPHPITLDEVLEMVPLNHNGVIFEIGDAISKRHLSRALDLIAKFTQMGENAVGILLAAIIPKFRLLLHAKELQSTHNLKVSARSRYPDFQHQLQRLPGSSIRHLPKKKDGNVNAYPLFLTFQDLHRFELPELQSAWQHALDANRALVTSSLNPRTVLERLLIKTLIKK